MLPKGFVRSFLEFAIGGAVIFAFLGWIFTGLSYIIGDSATWLILGAIVVVYILYGFKKHLGFWYAFRRRISLFFLLSKKSDWQPK